MCAQVILLTGPSGSGKTSLLRRVGAHRLRLDDFYRDGDEPGMPLLDGTFSGDEGSTRTEAMARIDWIIPPPGRRPRHGYDLVQLCAEGSAKVPVYSIPDNATVNWTTLDIGAAPAFWGLFAGELVERCRRANVLADALALRRPRVQTWWFRLRRDLAERRKPIRVLVPRGLRLTHEEPAQMRRWTAQGCRLVGRAQCEATVAEHIGSVAVPGNRADGIG